MKVEVTLTPMEFEMLRRRELSETACVVFDVLRATSTIVTALARGAESVLPVTTIEEALRCRASDPEVLLAGERNGLRIPAAASGGVVFDLGNSPREYTAAAVRGRRIVSTTTNGTRAFAACRGGRHVFAASFLNLKRTAAQVARTNCEQVMLVCSGTKEAVSFEDCLGAGAMCQALGQLTSEIELSDAANMVTSLFSIHAEDLEGAMQYSTNGRRLLGIPEISDDVAFCLTENLYPIVAAADPQGRLYRLSATQ